MVFSKTDKSHTMAILIESSRLGAIQSARDEARPYCRSHHFHSVLCLKLGHIKVQDTALSTLAGWKATASCTRSTGCESWPGLGVSVSGWPRCTRLTVPEQWDGAGPRHRLIYGDRPGPAGGQQQDSPKVLRSSWSQSSAKLINTKCGETKWSQTRELECFGIKHFQIFPKHIQTTKLYQVEFQVLVTRPEIKI